MAKRPPRRPSRMSDPDGVTNDSPMSVMSPDTDLSTPSSATEADDRGAPMTEPPSNAAAELTYDDIAARAYDLWVRRGHAPGSDFEDWLRAESELRDERRSS
jgi:Protein of unknown function (DUF2934)